MIHYRNQSYVRLRFTGQLALVLGQLDDEFLEVKLIDDNTIISTAKENTIPANESHAAGEKPKDTFNAIEKGCYAMLMPGLNGGIEYCYHLYFSNGTTDKWMIEAGLFDTERKLARRYFTVEPNEMIWVFEFSRDAVNLRPTLQFKLRKIRTSGTGKEHLAEIRLKAKTLFKRRRELFDGRYCYLFELDELLKNSVKRQEDIDIVHLKTEEDKDNDFYYTGYDFTPLSHEKDLHIEALVEDPMAYEPGEILSLQLKEMRKYIDLAAQYNLDHVFLIHGIGKGVLRNRIHRELSEMSFVKGYKNEYHPRYGWGATEVFFS
jgi:hypothetical protein